MSGRQTKHTGWLVDDACLNRSSADIDTVMGVAAASGQLVGGLLIHLDIAGYGWRSIFLVNVPVGIAALVAAPRLLPDTRVDDTPRPDPLETVLVVGGLTALVLPLIQGQSQGWPMWTWMMLAAAVA